MEAATSSLSQRKVNEGCFLFALSRRSSFLTLDSRQLLEFFLFRFYFVIVRYSNLASFFRNAKNKSGL